MRHFEDLEIGETLTRGGLVVDAAEAADFARRYDPECVPPASTAYVHRGPPISPWQAAALSWKLLSDLAATTPIEDAAFSAPADLQWGTRVSAGDVLRIEVELTDMLPPSTIYRDYGWARSMVTLFTSGPAGFGAWGDDDSELIEDVALTYFAHLKARRRDKVSIYYGLT
jgi:hypothetical protein